MAEDASLIQATNEAKLTDPANCNVPFEIAPNLYANEIGDKVANSDPNKTRDKLEFL